MNYLTHFGLREPPFGITPDTMFFYPCRSTQEALNTLLVGSSRVDLQACKLEYSIVSPK